MLRLSGASATVVIAVATAGSALLLGSLVFATSVRTLYLLPFISLSLALLGFRIYGVLALIISLSAHIRLLFSLFSAGAV